MNSNHPSTRTWLWLLLIATLGCTSLLLFERFLGRFSSVPRMDEPSLATSKRLPSRPSPLPAPDSRPIHPPQPLPDFLLRIERALSVDLMTREVHLNAIVKSRTGAMEVLVSTPYGRTHETIFVADCTPFKLHLALLLLGNASTRGASLPGERESIGSPQLTGRVHWEAQTLLATPPIDVSQGSILLEDCVLAIENGTPVPSGIPGWSFSGARVEHIIDPDLERPTYQQAFAPDQEGSLITTWRFPYTVIDNASPDAWNDEAYIAHTEALPPEGTRVVISLRSLQASSE